MRKIVVMTALAKTDEWWDSQTKDFQKKYIKDHPNSKYAKQANKSASKENNLKLGSKEKKDNRVSFISKKYPKGTKVVCNKPKGEKIKGTVVESYYTINRGFKNYSYVVKCEDGKERSFNSITLAEEPAKVEPKVKYEDFRVNDEADSIARKIKSKNLGEEDTRKYVEEKYKNFNLSDKDRSSLVKHITKEVLKINGSKGKKAAKDLVDKVKNKKDG